MNFEGIKNSLILTGNKIGFWFKKNSPEILLIGGLVGIGASVVLACVSSTKLNETLEPINKNIKKIKDDLNDDDKISNKIVDPEIAKKELVKTYFKAGKELVKLYGPSLALLSTSIVSILASHKIIKGREAAAVAAYTALDKAFKKYREQIVKELGEDKERELYLNDNDSVVDENGHVVDADFINKNSDNLYTFLFDEANSQWEKNGRMNLDFLIMTERYLNERLKGQGYLFLCDVYKSLHIDNSILPERNLQASRVVGWIYDPNDDTRDNYVSFGLSDRMGNLNKYAMETLRSGSKSFWLTFNPDGDILTGNDGQKTFMKYAKD